MEWVGFELLNWVALQPPASHAGAGQAEGLAAWHGGLPRMPVMQPAGSSRCEPHSPSKDGFFQRPALRSAGAWVLRVGGSFGQARAGS